MSEISKDQLGAEPGNDGGTPTPKKAPGNDGGTPTPNAEPGNDGGTTVPTGP